MSSQTQDFYPEQLVQDPTMEDEILNGRWLSHPPPGEEVMITGLAGMLPESRDIREFQDNLYSKVDMVTQNDRRWDIVHPEIPKRSGKLLDIEKFDPGFFGIHQRQANSMDPMIRILLERAVEAIMDAGYNPSELEGTRTGVFVGSSFSETEIEMCANNLNPQEFVLTGTTRSMIANRLSYYLKLEGPSPNVDTACSSSLYAVDHAFQAIRRGTCDQALVAGANLCLYPIVTLQFARLGVLSKDGACKVFDVNGDGYVRSEAAGVILLQKSKDARRVYARIIHARSNCDGFTPQSITYPSAEMQIILLQKFYSDCLINPHDLSYLEAHGTATVVGDPQEAEAIDQVYCTGRKEPLLVGSVKSNVGHSEPGSGFCSVAKVLITMENGIIPANINCTDIRPGVAALESGRIKLVTENTPLQDDRGLMGINNFGFGGANCHVLLRWNLKAKINRGQPQDNVPRLICVSGRSLEAVTFILDDVRKRQLDAEYVRLYHQIFSKTFKGHLSRGYSIISKTGEIFRDAERIIEEKPLFLFFGAFGKNWTNVAKDLGQIPKFVESTQRINDLLASKKLKAPDMVMGNKIKESGTLFNNILGNLTVQLALVDLLKDMGLKTTKVLGSGLGEFLCAYFENCLTLEQTVSCVYHVALALCFAHDNNSSSGLCLVKVNRNELEQLPKNVHLKKVKPDGVIIPGEPENLKTFKENLINQGVEVKEVDDYQVDLSNKNLETQLLTTLQSIITHPKPKTWLSTCQNNSRASAGYFLKCLKTRLSPKFLLETADENGVVLEIGTGQLKGKSLKKGLLGFEETNNSHNLLVFFKLLGRLFNIGQNLDLALLYPKVEYPVSRGTPLISPCIKWDHTKDWNVVRYTTDETTMSGGYSVELTLSDDDWTYVSGHVIDGRNLFPATAYLSLVWKAVAVRKHAYANNLKIVFENCRFLRATNVQKDRKLLFTIMIQNGSGNFEVIESKMPVVTGRVYTVDDMDKERIQLPTASSAERDETILLNTRDVYKELRLRGYNYTGVFKGIKQCNPEATYGMLQWDDNWVSFMDTMLQMKILQEDTRLLYVPVTIQKLTIEAKEHISLVQSLDEGNRLIPVYTYKQCDVIKSGGIEIRGLKASSIVKKRISEDPVLENYLFVPNETNLSTNDAIVVNVQLALENLPGYKVKVVEFVDEETPENFEPLGSMIHQALSNMPMIQPEVTILSKRPMDEVPNVSVVDRKLITESECTMVVGNNILQRKSVLDQCLSVLKVGGYILSRHSSLECDAKNLDLPNIDILTVLTTDTETLVLVRKSLKHDFSVVAIDVSDSAEFSWLPKIQENIRAGNNVIIYAQNKPTSGILGLLNCIRREPGTNHVRGIFIDDPEAPDFDLQNEFYQDQVGKNLGVNVYKNSQWGTYRHLPLGELEPVESQHCFVSTLVRGDLSTLTWIEGPLRSDSVLRTDEELVYVYYSSLNFRDVMNCSGKLAVDLVTKDRLKQEIIQGFEFSGRLVSGRRVMGAVSTGAQANMVTGDSNMTWTVPDEWTLEQAASVPVVYSTLIYAMVMRTRIHRGETILIHSGTGGIGLAAIRLALHYGWTVFTTVGNKEKREYLKKTFPVLKDSHIGNSRDTSFEQMIQRETNGRGVDVVLNSLAEEKLQASVRCLAHGGRFLEIGKFDLGNDNPLFLEFLKKQASFHGIMLDGVFESSPQVKRELMKIMDEAIAAGAVKPLVTKVFEKDQIEEAFRYMTTGKHIGKVVLRVRDEETERQAVPKPLLLRGLPRYFCEPNQSYVILGGLGGFGLELADWLVLRGARNLVLTSRTGLKTGYQAYRIRIWESYGVRVDIRTDDITTPGGCRELIEAANELGPVAAIFNLAVLLLDSILENQTQDAFRNSFAPKAYATEYLDQISRELCPELKDFVVFSSISCGRGNGGQTNYGMANSVMERICEKRKAEGFPALAIEWGAIGDVGIVAEMQEDDVELEIGGTLQQRIASCIQVLDVLMRQKSPIVGSMVVVKRKAGSFLGDNVVAVAAQILGIKDLKTISMHVTLAELGMDSMSAVEIRQTLEREFQVFLSPQDVRSLTFARLHEIQEELTSTEDGLTEVNQEKPLTDIETLIRTVTEESEARLKFVKLETKGDSTHPVLFVPGVEGVGKSFEPLARNLNVSAVSLQYPYEHPKTSIREVAQNLLPVAEKLLPPPNLPFHIVAYSQGLPIALEMINILEEKGRIGHLLALDAGPELITSVIKSHLTASSETDSDFETNLCCQLMSAVAPYSSVMEIKDRLTACENLDQRMTLCEGIVPADSPHTKSHLRDVIMGLCTRLQVLRNYSPTFKVKSSIRLYKPCQLLIKGLSEDYQLSEVKAQGENIEIKIFEGTHLSILDNPELAQGVDAFARLK